MMSMNGNGGSGVEDLLTRLESRPKPVLSHEFGVGSPCMRCDCPGLDLHFWRKICKVCSCRLDEHDVLPGDEQFDHGAIVTRKLFSQTHWECGSSCASSSAVADDENITFPHQLMDRLKISKAEGKENGTTCSLNVKGQENSNFDVGITLIDRIPPMERNVQLPVEPLPPPLPSNPPPQAPSIGIASANTVIYENVESVGKNRSDWAWTPAGDWDLARRYLMSLEEADRPLKCTNGAQLRRQRLAQQLPHHDSDVVASKANRAPREQQLHREFIELIKREVVGIAEVVDYGKHKEHFVSALPTMGKGKDGPNCRQCHASFDGVANGVGVVTDHEKEKSDAIWHPRCFTCSVCQQLLVDLLYFFRDGKYFCGRHFGEKLYPRCAGCDELIFAREYTFAEEKSWHLEHFCCFGCDKHLSGQRYVVKEDQPFCVDCYMEKFARTCASCCNKIGPFDQRITYAEIHWHADHRCFKCKHCAKPLSNQKFLLKENATFCSGDCKVRYGF